MNKIIKACSVCLSIVALTMVTVASAWIFHQPRTPKALQK